MPISIKKRTKLIGGLLCALSLATAGVAVIILLVHRHHKDAALQAEGDKIIGLWVYAGPPAVRIGDKDGKLNIFEKLAQPLLALAALNDFSPYKHPGWTMEWTRDRRLLIHGREMGQWRVKSTKDGVLEIEVAVANGTKATYLLQPENDQQMNWLIQFSDKDGKPRTKTIPLKRK